jgi:hypothetical protein
MSQPLEISVHLESDSLFKIDNAILQEILNKPVKTASGHAAVYQYSPGKIMKFSNPHEVKVYENFKHYDDLKPIVPKYYGYVDLNKGDLCKHFITNRKLRPNSFRDQKDHCVFVVIEDLLPNHLSKPHITDIKLGKVNFEECSDETKKQKHTERAKQTGMDVWGGRFDGISIHGKERIQKKELWSHSFSENLNNFLIPDCNFQLDSNTINSLCTEEKDRIIINCNTLLEKLSQIRSILNERQTHFNFLQSSVLLIYEGDLRKDPYADARLIDFDHTHFKKKHTKTIVTPYDESSNISNLGDSGAICGINSVIQLLNELIPNLSKFQ